VVKLERQGAPQQAALGRLEAKRRQAETEGTAVRKPKALPNPNRGRPFDYWLKIATLDAGNPILVPLVLYPRAKRMLAGGERVAGSVLLNRRNGVWHAQLVVEGKPPDRPAGEVSQVVGIDVGITAFATVSPTHRVTGGEPTPEADRPFHQAFGGGGRPLAERIERDAERFRRKQKLNACLRRKNLPEVPLGNRKTTAWVRNLIGFALNQVLFWLPGPDETAVSVEDLNVAAMRFKSQTGNRLLRASQLGFLRDRLQDKLDARGYRVEAVNPAFSSQECAAGGFVSQVNRPSHSEFRCDWCQFQINADCNASDVVAKRFGDAALNQLSVPRTGEVLLERFLARHQLLLRPLTPSSP
jgi:transposase